jgi:pimeloyl-ACP methyl ester carboxylesterase
MGIAIGRRKLVFAAAAAPLAVATGAPAQTRPRAHKARTFVLVHGAAQGGWCYRRVSDLLTARGHSVYSPTLTGAGERSHLVSPSVNLTTQITDIANLIKWEDLDAFVLCAHSSGGMVATGVAEQLAARIASIVYIDGFIPENDQSTLDISPRKLAEGLTTPPPKAAALQVNEKDRDWVDAKHTPIVNAAASERLKVTGAYKRIAKKAYVRNTNYPQPVFTGYYERLKGDRSWRSHALPCGHLAMVDLPGAVADILIASA